MLAEIMEWVGPIASIWGAVQGADIAKDANSQATQVSTGATQRANALMMEWLEINRSDIAEAVKSGTADLDTGFTQAIERIQPFVDTGAVNRATDLATGKTPASADPSIKAQTAQGAGAVNNLATRMVGGKKDKIVDAALEYGSNYASTFLDAAINRTLPRATRSLEASTNISNIQSGLGRAKADLGVGGAAKTSNITGGVIPNVAAGMGDINLTNTASGINRANINTNLTSDLLNVGNQAAALFSRK